MVFHSSLARATHRSGAALIAIADSVAAPIVEGARIMMARSVHVSREGCIIRKVATVWRSFTFFEARSINFAIVVYCW